MRQDRKSIPVSLPSELVAEIDQLIEAGQFGSRSAALRYGARLVAHQEATKCLHNLTQRRASENVAERLDRERSARD